jgi:hypothetical protein
MEVAAIAIAILGFAVGVMFRLRLLLSIAGLLVVVTIVFSVSRGFTFLETVLTVMAAQFIIQGSYFLGLLVKAAIAAAHRTRPIL